MRNSGKTSVTFVHLACTGATMGGSKPISRQIHRMKTLTEGRKIDAVTLSIGANDIKFAKIAQDCFELDDCSDAEDERSPRPAAEADLEALRMLYSELATELKNATRRETEQARDPEQARETEVFFTEYHDPLLARIGVCQKSEFKWWPIGGDQTITGKEATWASAELLPDLNGKGATAALDHGWTRVTGIAEAFRGHGYCASKSARWINQGNESRRKQGDRFGTLHPNARGYQKVYAPRLKDALEHLLHPERQEPR